VLLGRVTRLADYCRSISSGSVGPGSIRLLRIGSRCIARSRRRAVVVCSVIRTRLSRGRTCWCIRCVRRAAATLLSNVGPSRLVHVHRLRRATASGTSASCAATSGTSTGCTPASRAPTHCASTSRTSSAAPATSVVAAAAAAGVAVSTAATTTPAVPMMGLSAPAGDDDRPGNTQEQQGRFQTWLQSHSHSP